MINQPSSNTTIWVSNIVDPVGEVSFQGHPIAYIALSAYGHSQVRIHCCIINEVKSLFQNSLIYIFMCLIGIVNTLHKLRGEDGNLDSN